MSDTLLSASTSIFDRVIIPAFDELLGTDDVAFVNGDLSDPDDLPDRSLAMSRELWEEFGSPDTLTVTIRPGDHLN